jgi:regulation of enolase protein 1 (concanavalin A-like superfamily)
MTVLPDLPFALNESSEEVWSVIDGPAIHASAPPRTDLFVSPGDSTRRVNAPTFIGVPGPGDFQFSARVSVGFASKFDAGGLLLWHSETSFAKLCLEYSHAGQPMIVSVVTRGVSDDANSFTVADSRTWLRISRIDSSYAFHSSNDGQWWELIRVFAMDSTPATHSLGLLAQSPTGEGCDVTFDKLAFTRTRLLDRRDGS